MKVITFVTLRVGKPGEYKHLPPGTYDDKKDLKGIDVAALKLAGHAEDASEVVSVEGEGA